MSNRARRAAVRIINHFWTRKTALLHFVVVQPETVDEVGMGEQDRQRYGGFGAWPWRTGWHAMMNSSQSSSAFLSLSPSPRNHQYARRTAPLLHLQWLEYETNG
jgi:hypothetical protein